MVLLTVFVHVYVCVSVCALQLCVWTAHELLTVAAPSLSTGAWGLQHSCGRARKLSMLTSIINTWLVLKRKIWYILCFLQVLINYMSCFVGAVMYIMGLRCSAVQSQPSGYCTESRHLKLHLRTFLLFTFQTHIQASCSSSWKIKTSASNSLCMHFCEYIGWNLKA